MKIMKKIGKILILFMILLMITNYANISNARELVQGGQEILTEGLWGWFLQDNEHMDIDISIGKNPSAINSSDSMTRKMLGIIQVIGSVISVIALIIIGFRYMLSSLEEKAQMKGVLIYYIIGAVLVFATSNLLGLVYEVINEIKL